MCAFGSFVSSRRVVYATRSLVVWEVRLCSIEEARDVIARCDREEEKLRSCTETVYAIH